MGKTKVLVTGAGGFIGRYVVERLAGRGHDVRATDLQGVDLAYAGELGAETAGGNLLRRDFASEAVEGVGAVVHLAAAFDLGLPRELLVSTNVGTTINITSAAAAAGVGMFVQYSTCDVFGLKRQGPTGEDEPKKPQCAYSLSKLLSESAAMGAMRRDGLPVAVVRPTFVYGPGAIYTARSFMLLPALLSRYADSVPLPAGGPRTNTIHARDMAEATVTVLEAGEEAAGFSYNVADDSEMSSCEFLRITFEPFGITCSGELNVPWTAVETTGRLAALLPRGAFKVVDRFLGRRWNRVLIENELIPLLSPKVDKDFLGFLYGEHLYSNERIKSLGWEPRYRTFADGWPPTVKWYRDNRYIP